MLQYAGIDGFAGTGESAAIRPEAQHLESFCTGAERFNYTRLDSGCQESSLLAACALQIRSSSEASWSPVTFAIDGISNLQAVTALPWWCTLSLTAAGRQWPLPSFPYIAHCRSSATLPPLSGKMAVFPSTCSEWAASFKLNNMPATVSESSSKCCWVAWTQLVWGSS